MKKSFKKIIGILMALVLLLAIINVQPTKTEAATKYVKKYTKTITLERYKEYKLPIKMKKTDKLNVKIQLLTEGDYVEVIAFPKDKKNEEIKMSNYKGGLSFTKGQPQYTNTTQTFKIKKAPKGNASYLYMYIAGDSEFNGNKVKLKVTITTSKKNLSVGKLKEIK